MRDKTPSSSQNYSSSMNYGSNKNYNGNNVISSNGDGSQKYGSVKNYGGSQQYSSGSQKYGSQQYNEFNDSDDLLQTLNDFIKTNEKKLRNGTTYFTLNPICLEYLNLYLRGKRVSFKVSKSEILDLQFILSLIKHLRIDPNYPELLEKNRILDLTIFESIKELEMFYVKPGLILNLFKLSTNIERLTVNCSLNSLDELLIVEDENRLPYYENVLKLVFENDEGKPLQGQELIYKRFQYLYKKNLIWSNLKELDLSFNSIPKIDMTCYSLSNVEKLCFEGNLISKIENLEECLYLRVLNLSFNRIKSLDNINEVLGMITHLSLRGNQIEKTESLNRLYGLECLDISKNQIKHIEEVFKLNQLPNLKYLFTDENPFCELKDYRNLIIFNFLNNNFNYFNIQNIQSFYLDGKRIQLYEIEFINKHTVENGTFKTYQYKQQQQQQQQNQQQSSKDVIPKVEFAPNAKIDQVSSTSPHSNLLNTFNTMNGNNNNRNKPKSNKHRHSHPNFNHHKAAIIEPVIDNLSESDYYEESLLEKKKTQDDLKFEEENSLKKKIENLRQEGGNSWLLVLNEEETFKENINNYNHTTDYSTLKGSNGNLVSTPLTTPTKKFIKSPIKKKKTPTKGLKKINFSTNDNDDISNNNINNTATTTTTSNNNLDNQLKQNENNDNSTSLLDNKNNDEISIATTTPSIAHTNNSLSTSPLNRTMNIPIVNITNNTSNTNIITGTTPNNNSNNNNLSTSPIKINNSLSKSPTTTTSLSNTPTNNNSEFSLKNNLFLEKNLINNQELICEPFSIIKNNQNLLLQIKTEIMLETNLFGNSVNSYLLKNIVFVFDVPEAVEPNTIEIVFALTFKDGIPNSFSHEYYQMEDQESVKQILSVLQPPLFKEYTMNCMQCSERYICKMENDFFQCIKCQSKLLFYIPNISSSEHHSQPLMSVESPSTSFSNSLSLKDIGKFIEYSDEDYNNRISMDQNIQLFFKLKIFKGNSNEVFLYIMKSNYIRYNQSPQDDEKQIYLLLSSTTLYLMNRKEKKSEVDSFSVYIQIPLKDIKRIVTTLSSQTFRIEMDENQINPFIFLKRSQESTDRFLHHLFDAAKQLKLSIENINRSVDYRHSINALLLDENEEFLKYIMLHHKVSGRNIQPKSLVISNERLYLLIENYFQFPLLNSNKPIKTTSNQFQIFKDFKITDIINIKYSKIKPNYFTVVFEVENTNGNNQIIEWDLVTGNSIECETVVNCIKKQWKDKFGLELNIIDQY